MDISKIKSAVHIPHLRLKAQQLFSTRSLFSKVVVCESNNARQVASALSVIESRRQQVVCA